MEKLYVVESAGHPIPLPAGEYLITVPDDGVVTVAYRAQPWHTWGPPIEGEER